MTREELKEHCKKQIEMCEMWAKAKGENPCGKVYEEHKMILEILEQKPCEDCISRQVVPSYICNDLGFGDEKNGYDLERKIAQEEIYNFVRKMPPATPKEKTGWIPVSERLPQECIHTYDNNFHDYTRSESVLVTIRNKVTNSVYVFHDLAYISNGEWYIDSRYDHDRFKNCSVIAWMPLPEPYKVGSEK